MRDYRNPDTISLPTNPADAIKLQIEIAKKVVARDDDDEEEGKERMAAGDDDDDSNSSLASYKQPGRKGPIRVCGVDVSYRNEEGIAHCAAVVMDNSTPELNHILDQASTKSKIEQPYIPGLFMLREAGPVINTLELLEGRYDFLLIDGHGLLHPRRCGLASYVGVVMNKPTIGIAKSLLCGNMRKDDRYIELEGEVLGYAIEGRKPLYVSVGHRVSLESAISIVKSMKKKGEWLPEPLRIADSNSKQLV